MVNRPPTPYPDVNVILNLLLASVKELLQEEFVGIYLYGSLSSGDFDPAASDIDFLVITADVLTEKAVAELESMHYRMWNTGLKWADKLEGSYLTMCRSLYAMQYGKIISKQAAARWAGQELGGKWSQVIEQALAIRIGQEDFNLYSESLELICYTIEQTSSSRRK
jgi:hypothetical protein